MRLLGTCTTDRVSKLLWIQSTTLQPSLAIPNYRSLGSTSKSCSFLVHRVLDVCSLSWERPPRGPSTGNFSTLWRPSLKGAPNEQVLSSDQLSKSEPQSSADHSSSCCKKRKRIYCKWCHKSKLMINTLVKGIFLEGNHHCEYASNRSSIIYTTWIRAWITKTAASKRFFKGCLFPSL